MAARSRAKNAGRRTTAACVGLTLTLVAIAVVMAFGSGQDNAHDASLLAAAAVLAGAGFLVKRLCATRARSAELRAYHHTFGHAPTINTVPAVLGVTDPRALEDREPTSR